MGKDTKKVCIGLSGGVDSLAAAILLKGQGYRCRAVFMDAGVLPAERLEDARAGANALGIEFDILDVSKSFEPIIRYFCSQYQSGRTPNPCVMCNRQVKFGLLPAYARSKGADFFATGHYARVVKNGGVAGLLEAKDKAKDQSYALAMIDRAVLEHLLLPLGTVSKQDSLSIVRDLGIKAEQRKESQDICFVPDGDYAAAVQRYSAQRLREGRIEDNQGRQLGRHHGIHRYTIGQRRKIGVAMGRPYYVTGIDTANNTIRLGPKEQLMHSFLQASGVNWLTDKIEKAFHGVVKIRYNGRAEPAKVVPQGNTFRVEFDEAVAAITPGQLACVYLRTRKGLRVAGGGWIDKGFS